MQLFVVLHACYIFSDRFNNRKLKPSYVEAYKGDKVTFNCESLLSRGQIPTTWVFKKGPIFNLPYYQGSNSIKLNSVNLNDSGIYVCFGLEQYNFQLRHFIAYATLVVYGECF